MIPARAYRHEMTPMNSHIEFGLDTFGDITVDDGGRPLSHPEVLRNVVEEARLADRLGVDFFGVGEHHRADFSISAPEVILATIAGCTQRLKLGSAVTVLSTDDPVRVYERFATLDALSNGRAEIILGRGSFTESYPLFGYDLRDYEVLFEEKLELFAELIKGDPVTWSGTKRTSLTDQRVYPTTASPLKTWVGVGGNPESVIRAARHGFPLVVAIIGGDPLRFAPLVDLYRKALDELGQPPLPVAAHGPGHVADSDEQALDELWPHYRTMINRIGRERGWPPTTREQFEATAGPNGALMVGSPDTVAAKIRRSMTGLGLQRFSLKYSAGTLPHEAMMRSIELYATKVIPLVRAAIPRLAHS
jgi:probable LLM family oxidoreductase